MNHDKRGDLLAGVFHGEVPFRKENAMTGFEGEGEGVLAYSRVRLQARHYLAFGEIVSSRGAPFLPVTAHACSNTHEKKGNVL